MVAPNAPSSSTVPLMLGASRSNLAWPNTTRPSTVSLTMAGLHRSPVDVAVPVHSPSYGPAAEALLNCIKSSKKAAVATMGRRFIAKPSLLYVILRRYQLKRSPPDRCCHHPPNLKGRRSPDLDRQPLVRPRSAPQPCARR